MPKNRLVFGVGINDVPTTQNFKSGRCRYYTRWVNMLKRCYHLGTVLRQVSYRNCTVCEDWLTFSNFKSWMEKQDWEGKDLDKDLLVVGNKVYSPETCVFVHKKVNRFLNEGLNKRNKLLLGVHYYKSRDKYYSQIRNPFNASSASQNFIGYFETEEEAHNAYLIKKHQYACELADSKYVDDEKVANALRLKYVPVTNSVK